MLKNSVQCLWRTWLLVLGSRWRRIEVTEHTVRAPHSLSYRIKLWCWGSGGHGSPSQLFCCYINEGGNDFYFLFFILQLHSCICKTGMWSQEVEENAADETQDQRLRTLRSEEQAHQWISFRENADNPEASSGAMTT